MILTCPACGTQYVVKDGAIPAGGRKVRCASCRHSWHQDPEPLELSPEAEIAADEAPAAAPIDGQYRPEEPVDELGYEPGDDTVEVHPEPEVAPAMEEPIEAPMAEVEPVPEEEHPHWAPEPEANQEANAGSVALAATDDDRPFEAKDADDEFSPFARRDVPERPRRRPFVRVLLLLLIVAALAAAFWFLAPPAWKARVGLPVQETPLQLMMTHSDRQRLASGNELLAVSGRVINPTGRRQTVPPITAELRSGTGKLVYSWTIAPPARSLEPGASATFNSAEVNVPAGGEKLTVTLGAPSA